MRTNKRTTYRPGGLTLTRAALDHCGLAPGDPVLDAGCGDGVTCAFLSGEAGLSTFGMDLSAQRISKTGSGWTGIRARLPLLPFATSAFRAVFCECVLSLVAEKQDCLEEFFRLLKPGGHLVLTDLYLPGEAPAPVPGLTCLDGALGRNALKAAVEGAGFRLRIWEDHTRMLREMACQMVFKHGSLDNFWKTLTGDVFHAGLGARCRAREINPGYCLIIADKASDKQKYE
ncbi:MAG: methyltransferase domain-containing protein [Desulfobacter sp.]|nr:MAG: methyltransferase domain-containing protein [Desulfobacter sp.]